MHGRSPSLDAFFFSVQTMATIGYGTLVPRTRYANVLVVLETSVGILGLAMITGHHLLEVLQTHGARALQPAGHHHQA